MLLLSPGLYNEWRWQGLKVKAMNLKAGGCRFKPRCGREYSPISYVQRAGLENDPPMEFSVSLQHAAMKTVRSTLLCLKEFVIEKKKNKNNLSLKKKKKEVKQLNPSKTFLHPLRTCFIK